MQWNKNHFLPNEKKLRLWGRNSRTDSAEPVSTQELTPVSDAAPEVPSAPASGFSYDRQSDEVRATLVISRRRLTALGLAALVLLVVLWYATVLGVTNSRVASAEAAAFESGQTAGYDTGYGEGVTLGYDSGQEDGYSSGYQDGEQAGYTAGYEEGYAAGGYDAGQEAGYASGYEAGQEEGYASGYEAGQEEGYASGYEAGQEEGYASGYDTGVADGKASAAKETSSAGASDSGSEDTSTVGGTVYVSRNGKIHTNPNCSGMKYYTEMSYSEAVSSGYDKCQKCY